MYISEHFQRHEFACNCGCGFDTIDAQTLAVLEVVRRHFKAPVIVNSAARCPIHNRNVGGAPNSQHLDGRAADIKVKGVSPDAVADFIADILEDAGGIGRYDTFTHVDTRTAGPARWDERSA